MSYNSSVYNEDYYKSHCGENYERGNGWEEIFARQAERIVKEINPKTVLDVGCAAGYLVEGLRDRGVEANGIDVSSYAISKVRDDIKPFCTVQSATECIEGKYDLITCIEVMEHLAPEDFTVAIENMCNATDIIIFSSTPFDFNEESHYSINSPGFWVEKFAYNGFYHDVEYDCSYIAVQTMLFRRENKTKINLARSYEDKLFALWRENCTLRDSVNLLNARINDLDRGNIEHAQEVYRYNETIAQLTDQLRRQQDEQENQVEQEIKSKEQRLRMLLEMEYAKRDSIENKFMVYARRTEFLENELNQYQTFYESSLQEIHEKSQQVDQCNEEISLYHQSLLARVGYKFVYKKKQAQIERANMELIKKGLEYWKPVFVAKDYCELNPDIEEVVGTDANKLLQHFVRYGMGEGRVASKIFDIYAYCEYNPDVVDYYEGDIKKIYMHYIEHGINEQRKAIWSQS